MARSKAAILGASGMLGSMLLDHLSRDPDLPLIATVRHARYAAQGQRLFPQVEWRVFDAERNAGEDFAHAAATAIAGAGWVLNAIGKTKPYTHDGNPAEVEAAIRVNAQLPYLLAHAGAASGARIIQIATDCVYSGREGGYPESAPHDPLDVYGKSKSLGECLLPNVANLRCSIIGPEPGRHMFLLEWLRRQPPGARIKGFTNHAWNGVTTLQFARLCQGIMRENLALPRLLHIVPRDTISKAGLLECLQREYRRPDIRIEHAAVPTPLDRTLQTQQAALNEMLWRAAGYAGAPTVPGMVREVAACEYRLEGVFA
jgi:dTDP-4-dehydrorhamnose reductase